jgi:hypothetical protein
VIRATRFGPLVRSDWVERVTCFGPTHVRHTDARFFYFAWNTLAGADVVTIISVLGPTDAWH